MKRQIVVLQWIVIAVLVIGGGIAIVMATFKADEYRTTLDEQASSTASLKEQLRQAKNPTPVPQPALPEATTNGPATPTPAIASPISPARPRTR